MDPAEVRSEPVIQLQDILEAREAVSPDLHHTPLLRASTLGERIGAELWLKAELFQKTGSFKARGMLNRLRTLTVTDLDHGLITASAGNAGQSLAWAARQYGTACVVVMPEGASDSKIAATRSYGAEVVSGGPKSAVFERMGDIQKRRGLTFVHPFDDPMVIAGHGTLGLEIIEDLPDVDVIVVPVGGGGLISGIASAVKLSGSSSRIVGVEPEGAAGLRAAWLAGEVVHLDDVRSFADGLTAPMAGELALEITRELVDDLVLVSEEEILEALEMLMSRAKLYAEGAAAAPLAALLSGRIELSPGSRVVSVVSGGNLDLKALGKVLSSRERSEP